ncbi:MAG: peptidase S41 [Legionellales bacterium]|nr:peptidase S41 [Legionellales bacterium]
MKLLKSLTILSTSALIISSFVLPMSFGINSLGKGYNSPSAVPNDEIQEFVTAITAIKHYYISDTKDKTLFNNAISGMLTHLDPHSSYLDKEALKQMTSTVSGEFVGIGIELTVDKGALKVISPLDGTPADKAGLKTNDLIIKVDNTLVENMSLSEAISKIKGKKGTLVTLTILRPHVAKPIIVSIKRDTIKVVTVKTKLLDDHYGYARLSFFQGKADQELKAAIAQLKKATNNQLNGLVLDLRNNPGGLLNLSGEITDLFLDKNTTQRYKNLIVYTKGRIPGSDITIKAKPHDIIPNVPLVVLINSGSASASEIVAGALQDYHRAVIMGTKSFGKGSVQTVIPISKDTAIKLTTALYYTPSGRAIQAKGIQPNVIIPSLEIQKKDNGITLTEADFNRHLKNGSHKTDVQKSVTNKKSTDFELAQEDYQLFSALMMLKGLHSIQ